MRVLIGIVLLFVSAIVFSAQAFAATPADLSFTVLRNGEVIGTHDYSFTKKGPGLVVDINTDIKVKFAFVTVYRFEHRAREVWNRGKMTSTTSTTNDDGKDHKLKVSFAGKKLKVNGDGKNSIVDYGAMPASLWNPETINNTTLLNTLDGTMMNVKVDELGNENVNVGGGQVAARHYQLSGDLQRELWFDNNDTLVMVRFKGDDGSTISYELR